MADQFLQSDGVEHGYFDKRKDQFNNEIAKGMSLTGVGGSIRNKPKHRTNTKKTEEKVEGKLPKNQKTSDGAKNITPGTTMSTKDILAAKPSDLKGPDFVERMRLAREAKKKK